MASWTENYTVCKFENDDHSFLKLYYGYFVLFWASFYWKWKIKHKLIAPEIKNFHEFLWKKMCVIGNIKYWRFFYYEQIKLNTFILDSFPGIWIQSFISIFNVMQHLRICWPTAQTDSESPLQVLQVQQIRGLLEECYYRKIFAQNIIVYSLSVSAVQSSG